MSESTASGDDAPVGEALEHTFGAILRWSTRPEVRRRLLSAGVDHFSATDAWLIDRLVRTGPVRMRSLAEWQGVDKSTITAQIKRLEEKNLVKRASDPSDGRAILVDVTRSGRALRRKNSAAASVAFEDLLADWPAAERSQLVRLLDKLAARLEHED